MTLTEFDKKLIWERYNSIEALDKDKNYLDVLALDENRTEEAKIIMLENFTEDETNFEDFNFMVLMASIIIEEQI